MEMRHHVTDMAEVSTLWLYLLRAMYLLIAVVPWGYVLREYITAPGDPWSGTGSQESLT
jgi:hypothetical protein